jgi:hypothetical protein
VVLIILGFTTVRKVLVSLKKESVWNFPSSGKPRKDYWAWDGIESQKVKRKALLVRGMLNQKFMDDAVYLGQVLISDIPLLNHFFGNELLSLTLSLASSPMFIC